MRTSGAKATAFTIGPFISPSDMLDFTRSHRLTDVRII